MKFGMFGAVVAHGRQRIFSGELPFNFLSQGFRKYEYRAIATTAFLTKVLPLLLRHFCMISLSNPFRNYKLGRLRIYRYFPKMFFSDQESRWSFFFFFGASIPK